MEQQNWKAPANSEEKSPETEKPYLWRVRWIICAIVLAAALLLRFTFGGTIYEQVHAWYTDQMQHVVLPQSSIDGIQEKIIELFPVSSAPQTSSKP